MSVDELADLLNHTEWRRERDRKNELQRINRARPEVMRREQENYRPKERMRKRATYRERRADPQFVDKERKRARELARRLYQDPEYRAREQVRAKAWAKARRADPDAHARDLENARARRRDPLTACKRIRFAVSSRGTPVTGEQLYAILQAQGFRCAVTGLPLDFRYQRRHPLQPSVDHIIPVSAGGTNDLGNLRWVIWALNAARHYMEHDDVLAHLFRPSEELRARLEREAPEYVRRNGAP
jgi:hypothetical protein